MRALFLALLLIFAGILNAAEPKEVLFLASESDSEMVKQAFTELPLPDGIHFRYFSGFGEPEEVRAAVSRADLIIANGLSAEFREVLASDARLGKSRIYLLGTPRLAPRIPEKLREHSVFPMPEEVARYRDNRSVENFRNLVLYLVNRELDPAVGFEAAATFAEVGLFDPASRKKFASFREYAAFRKAHPLPIPVRGRAVVTVYSSGIDGNDAVQLEFLTRALEAEGLETVVGYGDEVRLIEEFLVDATGKSRFDVAVALSFKFKAGLGAPMRRALSRLDIPVINALKLYRQTTPEWEASEQGMNNFSVAFAMVAPEVSGLIDPSLVYGRLSEGGEVREFPMAANIARLASRAAKWADLRRKPNAEKRVALLFYHPEGGKQSIGASYLNVPRSLVNITGTLAKAGYATAGAEKFDEKELTGLLLAGVRNVGSWAPGELDALVKAGECVELPFETYREWFAELPEAFRRSVIAEWGEVEESKVMARGGKLVIPILRRGNLAMLPEPMRGYSGDAEKLLHSRTVAPPHQYVAAYLYLQKEFRADAVVRLGRHGTQEFLPGKQLGLSESCAPAVLGGDIPSLYCYVADGIGEGVIAKRRGGGVMISHLTPALAPTGEDKARRKLANALSEYLIADPNRKAVCFAEAKALAEGFLREAGLDTLTEENVGELQDYLDTVAQSLLPFGLHAFGGAPEGAELDAMAEAAAAANPGRDAAELRRLLAGSGQSELDALLAGLAGRRIEPGMSGDPVRSPAALPTGRNIYGFDPDKLPSRAAFAQGGAAAEKLIASYRESHNGAFPAKVAIVLWAGESVRTGGLNESVMLHLIGMEPEWDSEGRVKRFVAFRPESRPRIDVAVTASGAYRDQFAGLMTKLDAAQRAAAKLTDVENFLALHNRELADELVKSGLLREEADKQASRRIFSPAPGTYGVGVGRVAGASGVWEDDGQLKDAYLARMSYALDDDGAFTESRRSFEAGLKSVAAVLHSRSSNLYGVTDVDDMFQYLGGLSLAVRGASGRAPQELILDARRSGEVRVAPLSKFIAAELRGRAFNPEWIAALQKENYAGARTLARNIDNVWGWQAVTPENVAPEQWSELYEVYVKDRYKLGLAEFFRSENAWAEQSIAARMLEAVRKEYWNAPEEVRKDLAKGYAQSVIESGVACCDHTCNNPLLHELVVNLISLPGVMAPEQVAKFKLAVEHAAAKELSEQVRDRRALQAGLKKVEERETAPERGMRPVKGYKLVEKRSDDETSLSSSGIRWFSIAMLLGVIALFLAGAAKRKK